MKYDGLSEWLGVRVRGRRSQGWLPSVRLEQSRSQSWRKIRWGGGAWVWICTFWVDLPVIHVIETVCSSWRPGCFQQISGDWSHRSSWDCPGRARTHTLVIPALLGWGRKAAEPAKEAQEWRESKKEVQWSGMCKAVEGSIWKRREQDWGESGLCCLPSGGSLSCLLLPSCPTA